MISTISKGSQWRLQLYWLKFTNDVFTYKPMATKGVLIIVVANETEELNTIDKTRSKNNSSNQNGVRR